MTDDEWCKTLGAWRDDSLFAALKIREKFGDAPADPLLRGMLKRYDENASDLDKLMIKFGCMRG